jgi:hypothetical protein
MTDSSTAIKNILGQSCFSNSAADSGSGDIWIQAPIASQPYEFPEPVLINGIYAQSRKIDLLGKDQIDLKEFAAWEAASDEALINLEKGLA